MVLWGLGVIEQHGPHLPLGTDVYMPSALLRRVRQLLARSIDSVIMPPFYWGVNQVSGNVSGQLSRSGPEIMIELMVDPSAA